MDQLEKDILEYFNQEGYSEGGCGKRRNLNPKTWGPHGWKFIDKIVQGYPKKASPQERLAMFQFITSLGSVLPCEHCRNSHKKFTAEFPPIRYIGGRVKLRKWFSMYKKISL